MSNSGIAFIGAGNMARSLIGGLLRNDAGLGSIAVADPDEAQRDRAAALGAVEVYARNEDAIANAATVVLAIKPQIMRTVAEALAPSLSNRHLVISIAAGIRLADLGRWLGEHAAIVRTMPNTPALLGCGVTALYASAGCTGKQRDAAEHLMRAAGAVVWLDDEALMDAVTAISGSGPAYFFLWMETLERMATEMGLSSAAARLLTRETALGAARMALESEGELAELRHQVTSPGGTTAAAIDAMREHGVDEAIAAGVRRAAERSVELANQLGRID